MAWQVDTQHTQIAFAIRHLGISFIRGRFRLAEAQLTLDEQQPERSSLRARVDVNTLDTGEPARDGHLKTADLFNAEQHPYIEFASKSLRLGENGKFSLVGDLTIKGVSREVTLSGEFAGPVNDPISGKRKVGFHLAGEVSPKEFGINWNVPMEGGFMLADRTQLIIDAQAIEQA